MANGNSRPPGRPKGTPKTGGRQKGTPNKVTVEVREMARRLVEDPEYQKNLKTRLLDGSAGPGVESMLWHYAYGKPKERVEVSGESGGLPISVIERVIVDAGQDPKD